VLTKIRLRYVVNLIGRGLSGRGLDVGRSILWNLLLRFPSTFWSERFYVMNLLEMNFEFSLSNDHLVTSRLRTFFWVRMNIVEMTSDGFLCVQSFGAYLALVGLWLWWCCSDTLNLRCGLRFRGLTFLYWGVCGTMILSNISTIDLGRRRCCLPHFLYRFRAFIQGRVFVFVIFFFIVGVKGGVVFYS
jgi:hypothetical protein